MQQISICFCLCPFYVKKKQKKKNNVKQNPELIRFSKAQQEQTDTLT